MKIRRSIFYCSLFSPLLVLSSCDVGPHYKRPEVETPAAFEGAATQPATQSAAQPNNIPANWWKLFNDEQLTLLEEASLQHNPDLKAAVARVAQARAAAGIAKSQYYPLVTLDPSVQRTRSSGSHGGSKTSTNVSLPFDLSYEVDIWGRVRNSVESANASFVASESDFGVVLLTLEADVAQNYFTLRALDSQEQIFNNTVDLLKKELVLFERQKAVGVVNELSVAQAQTQLQTEIAQQLDIRRQRADTEHALAILTGRPPSELHVAAKPLAMDIPVVPAGLPADLLKQRPDVTSAEQNLVAANASVGVAKANYYPVVKLTGAAGFESIDLQHALDWESRVWSIGPSVSVPIFEGGKLTASLEQAKAQYNELEQVYRSAILTAFREVEDSLTDLHLRADEATAQSAAVAAAQKYRDLAQRQFDAGTTNYLTVIDADRSLLTTQLSDVQIRSQRLISTVLLIKALGGGWNSEAMAETQSATAPATAPATGP